MTANDHAQIAARRREIEETMDAEEYGIHKRTAASRRRVGAPATTASGVGGKRTELARQSYRRTAVASTRNREVWANRA